MQSIPQLAILSVYHIIMQQILVETSLFWMRINKLNLLKEIEGNPFYKKYFNKNT